MLLSLPHIAVVAGWVLFSHLEKAQLPSDKIEFLWKNRVKTHTTFGFFIFFSIFSGFSMNLYQLITLSIYLEFYRHFKS